MSKTKLAPDNEEGKQETPLQRAIAKVLSTEEGVILFRYLCDELGFLKTSIHQNPHTMGVLTDVMIGLEANRKVWLRLMANIPEEKLASILVEGRRTKIEIVDTTRERLDKWLMEQKELLQQQQREQQAMWDSRVLPG